MRNYKAYRAEFARREIWEDQARRLYKAARRGGVPRSGRALLRIMGVLASDESYSESSSDAGTVVHDRSDVQESEKRTAEVLTLQELSPSRSTLRALAVSPA